MDITAEEKLMYKVMKAIYDSDIPVDFKGAMVLKACLMNAGYTGEIRHTMDIDANWYSDSPPTVAQMEKSLTDALRKNGIDLSVHLYRMYGEGRSAGFELSDPDADEILFTMDMDVNRPAQSTQIYDIAGLRFRGISPMQMLADKISAISTEAVFRRIKDVVDLYYLSQVFELDQSALMSTIINSGRQLGNFYGFLYRLDDLQHAYEKFRFTGEADKPSFNDVYGAVKQYVMALLPNDYMGETDND